MAQSDELKDIFLSENRRILYPKGAIIVMQDSKLADAYSIHKGIVKVCDFDRQGSQNTIALLTKNHIFPFSWLVTGLAEDNALYYYQAATEVICYRANIDALRKLVSHNLSVATLLVNLITRSYINSVSRIQNLQKTNVEEKVDFIIYYLAILLGKQQEKNIYELETPFTHQDVADLAGLTRESVSRQFKKSKYQQVIQKKQKDGMTINLNNLDINNMPPIFGLET